MTPAPTTGLPRGLEASFETMRLLGSGGMGAVYLVRDRFLDRLVALKVLLAEEATAEHRERFLREARTSARLEHPHIIDVYRADETDGVVWFSMRYINGESLGDRLRERGPMSVSETVRVLREVSWGLAYAHARGVVHRDIKPDNILLDRDSGRAVLTDFGISRDAEQASTLTMHGHVLGSVHYMSPEQASGETVDGRSDIYALGCVAYHALAGRPPYDGSAQSVLVAHVTRPLPVLGDAVPGLPPALVRIVERCLAKEPSARYQTADNLAAELDSVLEQVAAAERAAADSEPGALLSEADALAIWQRAAQLQAEAAHRMERVAAPPTETSEEAEGYRVRAVEAAAVEAGISRQYVAIALAELRANSASGRQVTPVSARADRRMTLLMGTADRALSVSRVIPAAPKDTLQALGAVFTSSPRNFTVQDTINGHPLDGGILRFRVPRMLEAYSNPMVAFSRENQLRYRLEQIELFDLNVTLQARGDARRPACEVVITGDLREGLRRNITWDLSMMGGASTLAFAGATKALGVMLGVGALTAAPLAGAAGVAMLAAGGTAMWYRWLFRKALAKAIDELNELLAEVERHLNQRTLFSAEGALSSGRPSLRDADALR